MAKKKELSPEERLEAALVPEEEWPYEVPENWCWTYLESIIIPCKEKTEDFSNPDMKYIGLENLERDSGITSYSTAEGVKSLKNVFSKGQILYGKLRPYLNKHDIAPFSGICSTDILVFDVRKNTINRFVNHYFNLQFFIEYVVSNSKGINLPRVSENIVLRASVPLPPLPEQHRIVSRIESLFSKLDEAKEAAQAVVDGFEDRKAVILHKAFTGELTKEWRKSKGFSNMCYWTTLNIVCSKITDGTHNSPPNSEKGDYMYVTAKNIKEEGIDLTNITYVSEAIHKEIYSRCDVKYGDVLYIKDGATTGIATVNEIKKPFSMLSSVAVLRVKQGTLIPHYLAYALNSKEIKAYMLGKMAGIAITRLTLKKIKESKIPVFPLEEQNVIVDSLDYLIQKEIQVKESAESVLDQIDTMKKSILARAFRGELGTNDSQDENAVELLKRVLSSG